MGDRKETVRLAARIWRSYHRQEALCKSLMRMDISYRLRKLCSRGHMSAMLFKKEIRGVYESFKCNFSDGDLNSITRYADEWNSETACQATLLSLLIEEQDHLIGFYEKAMAGLWEYNELSSLCRDHLGQLRDLNKMLIAENNLVQRTMVQDERYGIVA